MSLNNILQNYIIKYSDQIKRATQPLRDHFGISYFSYIRVENNGRFSWLIDRIDWAEYYLNQGWFYEDPVLGHPSLFHSGFVFIESISSEEYKNTSLKADVEVFHLTSDVMFIEKGDDFVDICCFAGTKQFCALDKVLLNQPQLLKSFLGHFKKELEPILRKMNEEPLFLPQLIGDHYYRRGKVDPRVDSLHDFLIGLGMAREVKQAQSLSTREKECLKLLVKGKSAKETAWDLKLSSRTIESYFENIKLKLACQYKDDLFAIALDFNQLGLL